jgi:hypothetical protein
MADAARSGQLAFCAQDSVALLSRPRPRATAGSTGQGLFALMALRLAGPEARSDLGDPADLCYVRCVRGDLGIGSLTRHAELSSSAVAGQHLAILHDVGRVIAGRGYAAARLWAESCARLTRPRILPPSSRQFGQSC